MSLRALTPPSHQWGLLIDLSSPQAQEAASCSHDTASDAATQIQPPAQTQPPRRDWCCHPKGHRWCPNPTEPVNRLGHTSPHTDLVERRPWHQHWGTLLPRVAQSRRRDMLGKGSHPELQSNRVCCPAAPSLQKRLVLWPWGLAASRFCRWKQPREQSQACVPAKNQAGWGGGGAPALLTSCGADEKVAMGTLSPPPASPWGYEVFPCCPGTARTQEIQSQGNNPHFALHCGYTCQYITPLTRFPRAT